MNAKTKALVTGYGPAVGHTHQTVPDHGIEVNTLNAMNDAEIHETPVSERTMPKTIGMVVAAPFIGLAYVMTLPIFGIYFLVKLALEAYANKAPATSTKIKNAIVRIRNIGLFLAAPFVALAYVIALPMVGCFMIAKLAVEAHGKRAENLG